LPISGRDRRARRAGRPEAHDRPREHRVDRGAARRPRRTRARADRRRAPRRRRPPDRDRRRRCGDAAAAPAADGGRSRAAHEPADARGRVRGGDVEVTGAIVAVITREFIRFARQRGRLLATFARPLIWLVVVGAGFEKVVPTEGTVSYKQFLLPGIYGMVLLFSTMLSALATVHDREFGP